MVVGSLIESVSVSGGQWGVTQKNGSRLGGKSQRACGKEPRGSCLRQNARSLDVGCEVGGGGVPAIRLQ